jgi:MarR family transcriptional regulator for hemolysin
MILEHDFEQSVGCWVISTARLFERSLNEELAPHGITYQQWQVLAWLAYEGDLTQTALAQRLQVEAPTMVGILDRMERDGWVSRTTSPHDRRKKIVRPMPKVEPIWATILACARRLRARATQNIDPEELATVKRVLAAVRANLTGDEKEKPATAARPLQAASNSR